MKIPLAALALFAVAVPPAAVAQDVARGKVLFASAKCDRCHGFDPAKNELGPNLKRIVGRKAAQVKGFDYSSAMRKSAITWDWSSLNAFIAQPRVIVPRTFMPGWSGVEDSRDRQDLIAYLRTQ